MKNKMKINVFRRCRGGLNQLKCEKTKENHGFRRFRRGPNQLKYENPREINIFRRFNGLTGLATSS
jgi:hypothetical protein